MAIRNPKELAVLMLSHVRQGTERNTKLRTIGCALLLARMIAAGPLLAQESAPRAPEVEKQADTTRDTRPIAADKKPNVVFILADNVGYGDLGPYGGGESRGAPTPRIDQLASEGLRLTQYLVEPGCTPSRAALMTG